MREFVRVDHITSFSVGSFTRASMLTGIHQEDIQVMPRLCILIADGYILEDYRISVPSFRISRYPT